MTALRATFLKKMVIIPIYNQINIKKLLVLGSVREIKDSVPA